MLGFILRRATVIVTIKSSHGKIAQLIFINVREEETTMVAWFPQQVLLLLVLVAGTSAEATGETQEPYWSTYDPRRTSGSLSWLTSSTKYTAMETEPIGNFPQTSLWNADDTSSGTILDSEFRGPTSDELPLGQGKEMRRLAVLSGEENRGGKVKIARRDSGDSTSSTSAMDIEGETDLLIEKDQNHQIRSTSEKSIGVSSSRSLDNIVPTLETRLSADVVSLKIGKNIGTTPTSFITSGEVPRRQMRQAADVCDKFRIGDEAKGEFYSPNYPDPYPNLTECIRVLEAEKGMLLKLDFRDEFKLEDSTDCRFDFLEVRDGQHGYSNLLGNFCGTNFPPEITSKTRYLWLRFHSDENIEGKGFKAVWTMIPRPTYPGVPPEPEPCVRNVTGMEAIIHSNDVEDRKKLAEKEGIPLDCMWNITVKEGWKIQLTFPDHFKLQRPNECDANFVDIFKERTDMLSLERNFCGSIADTVIIATNTAFVRFYAEPKALNSSFEAIMTALRDKDAGEKSCKSDEYDCEDATCIAANLQCNKRVNCRFRWDEDEQVCNKNKSRLIDSQHIVIILIVFSLIVFGMTFAFVFNCIRKLIRDHRIIREHIRQSRENRLDELGRKSTPCPLSSSRTDIRDRGSESPSLEVLPSKELLPPTTLIAQECTKELVLEMTYNNRDMNDIHQSNNVSNATQERLQETSEEPEMRDNSCQTRESLFESRLPDALISPGFTTFGVRGPSSQNGTNHLHHHRHHHLHHQQSPQQSSHLSHQSSQQSSDSSSHQQISQCSGCSPASRGRDGSMGICPKHNPIPAPPGWSTHGSTYPLPIRQGSPFPEPPDYPTYQKFQSPKPSREPSVYRQSPKFTRQPTIGSGERYGSSMYGSGHASSNTTSSSQHSTATKPQQTMPDPRYRAEAVIEVDQRRPFSIESTKSAPDVIATH